MPETRPPRKAVRAVRNKEGTRVIRAIICTECGREDHVRFAPRATTRVLCRSCAATTLGVEDPDTALAKERSVRCTVCDRFELTRRPPALDAEFQCADCLRGIMSKQANRATKAERLSQKVIRVRRDD